MTWKVWTLLCLGVAVFAHLVLAPGILWMLDLPFYGRMTDRAVLDNIDLVEVLVLFTWSLTWLWILLCMGVKHLITKMGR